MNADKVNSIATFLRPLISAHRSASANVPFVLGFSGPQGCGKSTLVAELSAALRQAPFNYKVIELSLDDLYLTHEDQVRLSEEFPNNRLYSHRGEPGTHDVALGDKTLKSLVQNKTTPVPRYDKSKFAGQGDRVPEADWPVMTPPFDVVLFEGWCAGFRAISIDELEALYAQSTSLARDETDPEAAPAVDPVNLEVSDISELKPPVPTTLAHHQFSDLQQVNHELNKLQALWKYFDAFVHLDSLDINFTYKWRLQQEHALIQKRGSGMTDQQVKKFIDGYMPAYEMYIPGLREQTLLTRPNRQLRLVLDEERRVKFERIK
ncbi:putative kinase mug58 [Yarrowia sp. C11]|nr:putative kinase mug58 [Yarrowia sp. C11]